MTALDERVAIGTRKYPPSEASSEGGAMRGASADAWAVCRNVAYPPPSKLENNNLSQRTMHGVFALTLRACVFI